MWGALFCKKGLPRPLPKNSYMSFPEKRYSDILHKDHSDHSDSTLALCLCTAPSGIKTPSPSLKMCVPRSNSTSKRPSRTYPKWPFSHQCWGIWGILYHAKTFATIHQQPFVAPPPWGIPIQEMKNQPWYWVILQLAIGFMHQALFIDFSAILKSRRQLYPINFLNCDFVLDITGIWNTFRFDEQRVISVFRRRLMLQPSWNNDHFSFRHLD